MIAYVFPPEGSAGTYRPLRFVRHLPSHGWRPVVIAEKTQYYERYDPQLLDLVPSGVEIVRVPNPDPWKAIQERRTQKFRQKISSAPTDVIVRIATSHERPLRTTLRNLVHTIESIVYFPDLTMRWIRPATEAAIKACAQSGSEVIWATGGPWSSLVVARKVSRRTGLPYILDFRDSWTLEPDPFEARQPEWAKARNRQLLGRLFSDARAVVFRYMAEAESYWRAFPGFLDAERVHIIPNGYDGVITQTGIDRQDRCTVVYTGYIDGYWYESVFDALVELKRSDPDVVRKLRFVFAGEGARAISQLADRLALSDIVKTTGVLPFSETNQLQSRADALLLLGWRPGRGREFRGSKIFGYLKAARPIVGVLPDDENKRILQSVGVRTIAHAGSIPEIIEVFRRLVQTWSTGDLASLLPDPTACEKYSAERQTLALVRALEGLLSDEPFKPGACAVPPSLVNFISTVRLQERSTVIPASNPQSD